MAVNQLPLPPWVNSVNSDLRSEASYDSYNTFYNTQTHCLPPLSISFAIHKQNASHPLSIHVSGLWQPMMLEIF
jgi:hypothetical protein